MKIAVVRQFVVTEVETVERMQSAQLWSPANEGWSVFRDPGWHRVSPGDVVGIPIVIEYNGDKADLVQLDIRLESVATWMMSGWRAPARIRGIKPQAVLAAIQDKIDAVNKRLRGA